MSNVGSLPIQAITVLGHSCPLVPPTHQHRRRCWPNRNHAANGIGHHLISNIGVVAARRSRWLLTQFDWRALATLPRRCRDACLNRCPSPFEFAQGFLASQLASRNMAWGCHEAMVCTLVTLLMLRAVTPLSPPCLASMVASFIRL